MTEIEKSNIARAILMKTLISLDEQGIKDIPECLGMLVFMLAMTLDMVFIHFEHKNKTKKEMLDDINKILVNHLIKQESK